MNKIDLSGLALAAVGLGATPALAGSGAAAVLPAASATQAMASSARQAKPGHGFRVHRWGHRIGGRWHAGFFAPGGWTAWRQPVVGFVLPSYWNQPGFYVADYAAYGLPAPPHGCGWSRYYDHAVLTDRYGRVRDYRHGIDWERGHVFRQAPAPRLPDYDYGTYVDHDVTYRDQTEAGEYRGTWTGTWTGADGRTYSGTYSGEFRGEVEHHPSPANPHWSDRPHAAPMLPYYPGGYYASGYYYPAPTVTTVVVHPSVTTTTTTFIEEEVVYPAKGKTTYRRRSIKGK